MFELPIHLRTGTTHSRPLSLAFTHFHSSIISLTHYLSYYKSLHVLDQSFRYTTHHTFMLHPFFIWIIGELEVNCRFVAGGLLSVVV